MQGDRVPDAVGGRAGAGRLKVHDNYRNACGRARGTAQDALARRPIHRHCEAIRSRAVPTAMLTLMLIAGATSAGDATQADCEGPTADVERIEIMSPAGHWRREGFAEMVPAIRLPTTHDTSDVIRVFLKVPSGARIAARMLPDQRRATLIFPPGTQADRVEMFAFQNPDGSSEETVVDVRGTTIDDQGRLRFHALRPEHGGAQAPVLGWSWPAGDEDARNLATCLLMRLSRQARTPVGRPPLDDEGLRMLQRLNDCSRCHLANHQRDHSIHHAPMPRRETDQSGFYTPLSVLNDAVALAATRPLDLNAGDPYVSVSCDSGPAMLAREQGWIWYRCADDSVPVGRRDISAGLRDGDSYTRSVCAARRYLFEHMDQDARKAFAEAFAVCGIGRDHR